MFRLFGRRNEGKIERDKKRETNNAQSKKSCGEKSMPNKRIVKKPVNTRSVSLGKGSNNLIITQLSHSISIRSLDDKKAWRTYILIFENLAKVAKISTVILHFEAPEITRSLFDVMSRDQIARRYKIEFEYDAARVKIKKAAQIISESRGFDISLRMGEIGMAFLHSMRMQLFAEPQLIASIAELFRKMYPKAKWE